jgi:YesN/AraC family two-component response regulator
MYTITDPIAAQAIGTNHHIYTILRHMERAYMEPITLEELAQMYNFTPSYIISGNL